MVLTDFDSYEAMRQLAADKDAAESRAAESAKELDAARGIECPACLGSCECSPRDIAVGRLNWYRKATAFAEERDSLRAALTAAEGERDKWRDIAERPGHHFAEYARRLTEWAERWTAADARAKAAEGERDALRGEIERLRRAPAMHCADIIAESGATLASVDERDSLRAALAEARGREKALREALTALVAGARAYLQDIDSRGAAFVLACRLADAEAALALPYSPEGRPERELQGAAAQQLSDLADALEALVARLDFVHADGRYIGVWTIAQIHVGPYGGPAYTAELNAARAALRAAGRLGGEK